MRICERCNNATECRHGGKHGVGQSGSKDYVEANFGDKSIRSKYKSCTTSHKLWLKLEGIYQSKGFAKKAHLLKRLTLLKMRKMDNIHDHINAFIKTVEKL